MTRRYFKYLFGSWCAATAAAAVMSYHCDPFWYRSPNAPEFDGRRQRLNLLVSAKYPCRLPSVLLGSSRTLVLGNSLEPLGIYNYSFYDAFPEEFLPVLEVYRDSCGRAPERIYLGLDFFASSSYRYRKTRVPDFRPLLDDARNPWRYQFSITAVTKSVAQTLWPAPASEQERPATQWNFAHRDYYEDVYRNYALNPQYERILTQIVKSHPNSKIVGFIAPTSAPLWELMLEMGLEDEHRAFVELSARLVPTLYNFDGPNAITRTPENFKDENHLFRSAARRVLCGVFARDCEFDVGPFRASEPPQALSEGNP